MLTGIPFKPAREVRDRFPVRKETGTPARLILEDVDEPGRTEPLSDGLRDLHAHPLEDVGHLFPLRGGPARRKEVVEEVVELEDGLK